MNVYSKYFLCCWTFIRNYFLYTSCFRCCMASSYTIAVGHQCPYWYKPVLLLLQFYTFVYILKSWCFILTSSLWFSGLCPNQFRVSSSAVQLIYFCGVFPASTLVSHFYCTTVKLKPNGPIFHLWPTYSTCDRHIPLVTDIFHLWRKQTYIIWITASFRSIVYASFDAGF